MVSEVIGLAEVYQSVLYKNLIIGSQKGEARRRLPLQRAEKKEAERLAMVEFLRKVQRTGAP